MSQNTSSAVMQQRSEPRRSVDDFPTPPWGTRALCEFLIAQGFDLRASSVREPAANRGFMARPLGEYFGTVIASDLIDYGAGYPVEDFLFPYNIPEVDWTITNPPFTLADQFVARSLETSHIGCAIIVRSAFLEGIGRYETLFRDMPPAFTVQFVERIPMVKGRIDQDAASATAYSWIVWVHGERDTRQRWIAPCRKRLERPEDYVFQAEA